MSKKDNRAQELEVVNTAFFLEGTLATLRKEKHRLDNSKPAKPSMPKKPILDIPSVPQEAYPEIPESKVPFPQKWKIAAIGCLIGALLSFVVGVLDPMAGSLVSTAFLFGALFCVFKGFKAKTAEKNAQVEAYKNSLEYKSKCNQIDRQNKARQEQAEIKARERFALATQEYEQELLPQHAQQTEIYRTEILPEYQAEQTALTEAITTTENALQEVYGRNILPGKYRNLAAVTFLAAFMGTSQYDLKFSIERYDKDIDQLIARENLDQAKAQTQIQSRILGEQQYANYLNEQTQSILADSNDVLRDTRNWVAADTAMHAYDIQHRRKKEKEAEKARKSMR